MTEGIREINVEITDIDTVGKLRFELENLSDDTPLSDTMGEPLLMKTHQFVGQPVDKVEII